MSRCKYLPLPILAARPSPIVNSSVFTHRALLLPFLYPSRSISSREDRKRYQHLDEEVPFVDGDYFSGNGSHRTIGQPGKPEDPWEFLYRTPHDAPNRKEPTYPAPAQRERLQPISTITEREREIFTKIFESILSEKSSFVPQMKESGRSFPSNSLTQLFESAVGPLAYGSEISFGPKDAIDQTSASAGLARASGREEYPYALRAAAATAAGMKQPTRTATEIKAERERAKILAKLIEDMGMCKTDLELYIWLNKHVFSMVPSPAGQTPKDRKFPSTNYADLLVEAMRTLRQNFNDLAGAISVFERIKRLGAESYVVGCSSGVYNEILETKWEAYRDVHKIVELVDEMEVNAIEGNQKTVEILRSIISEVERMKKGEMGQGAHLFFTDADMVLLRKLEAYLDKADARSFEPPDHDPLVQDTPDYAFA